MCFSVVTYSDTKLCCVSAPFCMNFYLDMVNTTGGAVAWAFLKPMLLGQVLYTPDTPLTREIIRKVTALKSQSSWACNKGRTGTHGTQ